MIELTQEQQAAKDTVLSLIDDGNSLVRLGGYAGTGKTTLLRELVRELGVNQTAVCAYSGKAVSVLTRKQVKAASVSTIHRLIYEYEGEKEGEPSFSLRLREDLGNIEYIVVDEASMIGKELLRDLQSFGKQIIAVGDPGQLEPVNSSDVYLMDYLDACLETIHRQAESSPILRLATRVRNGFLPDYHNSDLLRVGDRNSLFPEGNVWDFDMILAGRVETVRAINTTMANLYREKSGDSQCLAPFVGSRLLVTQNNYKFGVFNGMLGTVTRRHNFICSSEEPDDDPEWWCRVTVDFDEIGVRTFPLSDHSWRKRPQRYTRDVVCADFGYAMTVHKAQGSEWDTVYVRDEPGGWDQVRWRYTAITRAAKRLVFEV